MTTQTDETRQAAAAAFVERVRQLDKGELAALRRNAGNTLAEARGTAWFYRVLDDDGFGINQELYFLVATLMGMNVLPFTGDFGKTMRVLKNQASPDAVDRRFRIVLDADFDRQSGGRPGGGELAFRLRQLVKLAASKGVGVDWPCLLIDLCRWRLPDKPVQRRWAESFYAPSRERDTE